MPKKPEKTKLYIVNLGCPRNQVDSEVAAAEFVRQGFELAPDLDHADAVLVNTCGFIEEAKQESIDTLLELAELKKSGKIKTLIAMGCLTQRYAKEILKEIKEIDIVSGVLDERELKAVVLAAGTKKKRLSAIKTPGFIAGAKNPRVPFSPEYSAYIKISEGCMNHCSYCAIPFIKGPLRSRAPGDILKEIKVLNARHPLSEIILIGQDTASYGLDLRKNVGLPALAEAIAKTYPESWLRLLYLNPLHIHPDLFRVMRDTPNICRYADVPIEHAHPLVLQRMQRGGTKARARTDEALANFRKIPGMILRSSVIVGFPGENDEEFKALMDYILEWRFERLGAFIYSREEGTGAYSMKNQVPAKVKKKRFDALMTLQKEISLEWNRRRVGGEARVLAEEALHKDGRTLYAGRSEADAPDVDGRVFFSSKEEVEPGEFVRVRITSASDYDAEGEAV